MNRGLQDIFEMLIDVSEITKYIPREKKGAVRYLTAYPTNDFCWNQG